MQLSLIHIDYLKMQDVCNILGLKDYRSAKKWLHDNNIVISTMGGKNVVCQFSFEFKRQQEFVEQLKVSYPIKWFEIYDANTTDKGMVKSIRELYPETKAANKKANKNTNLKTFIT